MLWGTYGFANAFNIDRNWYDRDVIGIDLGMALLAIENYRSGIVWALMDKLLSNSSCLSGGRIPLYFRARPANGSRALSQGEA